MEERTIKGPIEYIKEAIKIYTNKENFVYFAKIMAVLTVASLLISIPLGYFFPDEVKQNLGSQDVPLLISFVLLSIASIIVGLWTQVTTYYSILRIGSDEKEILTLGFKKIGKFFLVTMTLSLIIVFGFILLIIPAILFGVWYAFTTFLVLDKEMGIRDSLKLSKQMAKGNFWKIIGRTIVFGFFTIVVSILLAVIPYLGSIALSFVAPLFMLPFYLLYKDLSFSK